MTSKYRIIPKLGPAIHDELSSPLALDFVESEGVDVQLKCWFEVSGIDLVCPYFCT